MKNTPPDTSSFWQMTWYDDTRKKHCINVPVAQRDKFIAKLAEWRITGRSGTVWYFQWQWFDPTRRKYGQWHKKWVDLSEYNLR